MKIVVTQGDIDRGRPGHGDCCAIACAIKRQLGGVIVADSVIVEDETCIEWDEVGGLASRWPMKAEVLPHDRARVGQFIEDFDAGKPTKPFSFDLEADYVELDDDGEPY